MQTMEYLFSYSPMSFNLIANILVLGYGAHLAGLVYFISTRQRIAPRYRATSTLATVVMVTAFLILFRLQGYWENSFTFDPDTNLWGVSDYLFSNGLRYINWTITIPALLLQLVVVLDVKKPVRFSLITIGAAIGMIYTGYIGQFHEVTNTTAFLVWGTISTLFYIPLLYFVLREVSVADTYLPSEAKPYLRGILLVFVVAWTLYPGGYLFPVMLNSEFGSVGRQITFTVADVTSKVIYGILISRIALIRSRQLPDVTARNERVTKGEVEAQVTA